MSKNLQEKDGLSEDGDLKFRLKAQALLAREFDDCSTNAIGNRIIEDSDEEEAKFKSVKEKK